MLSCAPRPGDESGGSLKRDARRVSQATIAAENHALRQQRMFLRDVVTRLLYKKTWNLLAAPINDEELPGYSQRVDEPMDLSTLLWKVDSEKYLTIDAFLKDVHLITKSAHQYWGERTDDTDGRQMLSKAHALEDTIAQMASALDPQLVAQCQEIEKARNERANSGARRHRRHWRHQRRRRRRRPRDRPTLGATGRLARAATASRPRALRCGRIRTL